MRLERWGQHSATVLECDKLIIPVHLGCHWTCAVISLRDRGISYFDSLGVSCTCWEFATAAIAQCECGMTKCNVSVTHAVLGMGGGCQEMWASGRRAESSCTSFGCHLDMLSLYRHGSVTVTW